MLADVSASLTATSSSSSPHHIEKMADSIASLVSRVIARFSHLLNTTQNPIVHRPSLDVHPKLVDEQARFKVWAGNVGAHKTGRSSLEYRLRDASGLRLHVGKLLISLIKSIDGAVKALNDLGLQSNAREDGNQEDIIADLDVYIESFPDIINCLMRLIITIQNPAPWDRFIDSKRTDTSMFEAYDIQHVSAKFEGIDSQLAQRLGKAISRRRQYFKYRELRHEKLSRQMDEQADANVTDTISSTVASSFYNHSKPLPQIYDFSESQDVASVTSYDASTLEDAQERSVPDLPKEAYDGPFECQFCFMIVDIRDTRAWRQHVYDDLRPYNCLAKDCIMPDQDFGKRHEWMHHMIQNHLRIWYCPFNCDCTFKSASQSAEHLQTQHRNTIRDEHVNNLVKRNSQPLDENAEVTCELCSETLSSLKSYRHHAGKHQQQLALFALPHVDEPEPEQGQANQASNKKQDSDSDSEAEAEANSDSGVKTDPKGRRPDNDPSMFTVNISNPFQKKRS
ncbi:hypothetical protein CTAM01_07172 [Colletotrichum tamarilloi]|uniref:C2H2-type domain-containing protein n=1 Tax=Colletotrichum tamarilloi TaxID=1209934 RepID=A0ABQ9RA91_9PEZI|nr:uncharacterized protein CTAM01_07172 [Colletotrichum tamarilloi]KAK1499251.1 hypothetical protein CTAM01_07172 [Colletotrichum tamarilloi]